jgi:hypothetical protein
MAQRWQQSCRVAMGAWHGRDGRSYGLVVAAVAAAVAWHGGGMAAMVTVASWWLRGMAVAALWRCRVCIVVVVVDALSCLCSCSLVVVVAVVCCSGGARSGGRGSRIVRVLLPRSESWLRRSGRCGWLQQAKGVAPPTAECTATQRVQG